MVLTRLFTRVCVSVCVHVCALSHQNASSTRKPSVSTIPCWTPAPRRVLGTQQQLLSVG